MYCNKCRIVCFLTCSEREMLRQVKSVWVIVNIDLLCVPLLLPLLAGYNRCIWGKKDYYNYYYKKKNYCSRKVFCSFTQAQTDWQLPLAEPLPITCIDQSFQQDRLWVTSPPNTNTPPSIVPPPHIDWQLSVKTSEIQMQKELRFHLSFGRLNARRRESEKANVVINIAI